MQNEQRLAAELPALAAALRECQTKLAALRRDVRFARIAVETHAFDTATYGGLDVANALETIADRLSVERGYDEPPPNERMLLALDPRECRIFDDDGSTD